MMIQEWNFLAECFCLVPYLASVINAKEFKVQSQQPEGVGGYIQMNLGLEFPDQPSIPGLEYKQVILAD